MQMNPKRLRTILMAIQTALKNESDSQKGYRAKAQIYDCPTFERLAEMKEETIQGLEAASGPGEPTSSEHEGRQRVGSISISVGKGY